jgi:hypothetical protein
LTIRVKDADDQANRREICRRLVTLLGERHGTRDDSWVV